MALSVLIWTLLAACTTNAMGTNLHEFLNSTTRLPCGIRMPMHTFMKLWGANASTFAAVMAGDPALGVSDGVYLNPRTELWPTSADGFTYINYCYLNEPTRNQVKHTIDGAIQIWYDAFGGPAGAESKHSIRFKERTNSWGDPQYCVNTLSEHEQWSPFMSLDTLCITDDAALGNSATIGFQMAWEPFANDLNVATGFIDSIAHELGYIIGFGHEMQRGDSATYVRYRCKLLDGVYDAFVRAAADDHMLNQVQSCNSKELGLKYESAHYDYMIDPLQRVVGPYDVSSIMHYATDAEPAPLCYLEGRLDLCPLVKYVDPFDHSEGVAKIEENEVPSQHDVEWVKQNYKYPSTSLKVGNGKGFSPSWVNGALVGLYQFQQDGDRVAHTMHQAHPADGKKR